MVRRLTSTGIRSPLSSIASLVAIAVERIHYVEVAQNTLVQMESESLRNSLLSAISHDLRTPLSVLVGLAESLSVAVLPSAFKDVTAFAILIAVLVLRPRGLFGTAASAVREC